MGYLVGYGHLQLFAMGAQGLMDTIINYIEQIISVIASLVDFVVQLVADLVQLVAQLTVVIGQLPTWLNLCLPTNLVATVVGLLSVVVIFKILGREG